MHSAGDTGARLLPSNARHQGDGDEEAEDQHNQGAVMLPQSGDILIINREASVQFARPILFRVIRRLKHDTYDGWLWLEGYELDPQGDAVERREIFVQARGLRPAIPAQPVPAHRRPTNTRDVGARSTGDVYARRAVPGPRTPQRNGSPIG